MPVSPVLKWSELGTLDRARNTPFGGVYLITWNGSFKRAVYVGTSTSIGRRLSQHYEAYLRGDRTIWRVKSDEDVYELMTSFHIRNYVTYFQRLARDRRVWASTALDTSSPKNLVAPKQEFDSDWRRYTREIYLPNLSVSALRLPNYDPAFAVGVESAIQTRLMRAFELGRFFNHKRYTPLGKVEIEGRMPKVKVSFDRLPDLDDASKLLLGSLDQSQIPNEVAALVQVQLHNVLERRLAAKEERRRRRKNQQGKHQRAGAAWTPAEQEKLRVMLVDFDLSPADMAPHIERPASAIALRIEKNDRLTHRRWRQNIKFLF